ncbi:hypothetical protein [Coralloluteibacterium stylophorae]|uniref:Uncharacterized protein n=1 Tax=Coralloluteibacterium stylophorae TaxID=1776034 RepID=A0AAP2G2Q5_9GAMM|nr:hypothetical protein [Coralloluteibacterium stylophorae]MBS7458658.1 hypothetical protein [Coralloluteibacterium stylophorae]
MQHIARALGLAFFISATLTGAERAVAAPPPASAGTVRSVWTLDTQSCEAGGANAFNRHPNEREVQQTGRLEVPEIGYALSIPELPWVDESVVKVRLDDRSRGLSDHYLLLSEEEFGVPYGAIVVSPMPEGMRSREHALAAAQAYERGIDKAQAPGVRFAAVAGPYGDAVEMLVPDRVGSNCFPTSAFVTAPSADGLRTFGISRFAFHDGDLLEFSLVVELPADLTEGEQVERARALMDGFWQALVPIDRRP